MLVSQDFRLISQVGEDGGGVEGGRGEGRALAEAVNCFEGG